jgi:hypothetical protein
VTSYINGGDSFYASINMLDFRSNEDGDPIDGLAQLEQWIDFHEGAIRIRGKVTYEGLDDRGNGYVPDVGTPDYLTSAYPQAWPFFAFNNSTPNLRTVFGYVGDNPWSGGAATNMGTDASGYTDTAPV